MRPCFATPALRPVLALALGAAACQPVDSASIKTSGIYADLLAQADGSGSTQVTARLRVGGALSNTVLDLSAGDQLAAASGDERHDLARHDGLLGDVYYGASFSGDSAEKPFTVAFTRTGDTGAPSSAAALPAPFTLASPAAGASFSRARDSITVRWSAATADRVSVSLVGACVQVVSATDQSGADYTVNAGQLQAAQDHATDTCPVTITVTRERAGHVDAAYGDGGVFVARQVRTVAVQSKP
jgi:hypothetical protein